MSSSITKLNAPGLVEVSALPVPYRVPLQYGSTGYDREQLFIIKGIIPESSFISIYGPSGSFKSFLALDWACHIATGKAWDGRKVSQGSVLYVAGEGGFGVTQRIKAWELQHNKATGVDRLAWLSVPVFPTDYDQVDAVIEYCEEIKSRTDEAVKLVILDTLARCYGGNDENSSRDMGAFIRGCDAIKQRTGASILVVHHSGKNAENGARGSSSLPAALDAEYSVKRENEEQAIVLTCSKMKDSEPPGIKAYDLINVHIRTDSDGDSVSSLCVTTPGRLPNEDASPKTKNWTPNHTALLNAVRSRDPNGDGVMRHVILDDLKHQKLKIKGLSRWADKLCDDGLLRLDGERIYLVRNEE